MARHALLGPLAAALPFVALLGCRGSHDDRTLTPVPPASSPANESASVSGSPGSPAPVPVAALPSPSTQPEPKTPVPSGADQKKLVATVNGKPLVAGQVYSVYRMSKEMLQKRGRTLTEKDDQALRADSLEVVIADELLYQEALATGVVAPPDAVEASLKQLRLRAGSEEAYLKFLADSELSESGVRKLIERNVQTEIYRNSLLEGKGVTEEQAKKFYAANLSKGLFNVPEQVRVQSILVKANEKDPDSVRIEARKRIEELASRAAAGEDFAALAKQYSQEVTAARGGDTGLFPRGVMFPKFEEVAFAGKPGDVTPVFETPKGFNVMKILERKPESTRTFDEVKSALMADLGRVMRQDVVRAKIHELAARAKIAVLDGSFQRPAPPTPVAAKVQPPGTP